MKTKLIQIGNSRGIRIPKALIEQSGLVEEVDLKVEKHQIIIKSVNKVRSGWEQAFQTMAEQGDDRLLDGDNIVKQSIWDDEEWEW